MDGIVRGSIVWAALSDPVTGAPILDDSGKPKARPGTILSSNDDITAGMPLLVASISSKFDPRNCPSRWIPLEFSSGGHPVTGLNKPCVVKSDWTEIVSPEDFVADYPYQIGKRIPSSIVRSVLNWIRDNGEQ